MKIENLEELRELYKEVTGREAVSCKAITGSGSNRQYFRLTDETGKSLIGVIGTSVEENHAFIYIARHFASKGIPVPEVLKVSDDEHAYLQNDLGSTTLFDTIKQGREAGGKYSKEETELLHRVIRWLPKIQVEGAKGMDFNQCYPQPSMDEMNVMFDLNYFKYCFLKATGVDFHEIRLEEDFRQMALDLTKNIGQTFCYRDFQARNVMLDANGEPYFIDFQGGRRGPLAYDVASFLWQASARYPSRLREELIGTYIEELRKYTDVDEESFRQQLRLVVLFRLLQVLGAYGFRGYFERKKHFLDSIPPALDNLRELLKDNGCPYPYLREVLGQMVEANITSSTNSTSFTSLTSKPALKVRVFSFSFKKGIPEDTSGNGGGYVFDCRSTHNPGRYEPYKKLTGLDEPVIRFLEDDGEILTFLESVYRLADAHVERYIERGFTDLMFSFGCTGGQHRSVYSAQHLAEHLNKKYGITVELCHREQGIKQTLKGN